MIKRPEQSKYKVEICIYQEGGSVEVVYNGSNAKYLTSFDSLDYVLASLNTLFQKSQLIEGNHIALILEEKVEKPKKKRKKKGD